MSEYYTVVTKAGFEALLNALNGIAFPAFYMAVGDSQGSYYEPEETQTALKGEQYRDKIFAKGKRDNCLYFDLQIPPSVGDFTIREVGLFTADNTLLAVAKYPQNYKAKAEIENEENLSIEIQIELSDKTINTIVIDNSGNLLTQEKLEGLQKEFELNFSNKANTNLDNLTSQGEVKNYAPRFCFNSGSVDSEGNANLLQFSNTEDSKKIILKSPSVYTDGSGVVNQISQDIELDINDLQEGDYSIQIFKEDENYKLKAVKDAQVFRQKQQPEAKEGDLWLNTSIEPYCAYVFSGEQWTITNLVEVGKLAYSEGGGLEVNSYNHKIEETNNTDVFSNLPLFSINSGEIKEGENNTLQLPPDATSKIFISWTRPNQTQDYEYGSSDGIGFKGTYTPLHDTYWHNMVDGNPSTYYRADQLGNYENIDIDFSFPYYIKLTSLKWKYDGVNWKDSINEKGVIYGSNTGAFEGEEEIVKEYDMKLSDVNVSVNMSDNKKAYKYYRIRIISTPASDYAVGLKVFRHAQYIYELNMQGEQEIEVKSGKTLVIKPFKATNVKGETKEFNEQVFDFDGYEDKKYLIFIDFESQKIIAQSADFIVSKIKPDIKENTIYWLDCSQYPFSFKKKTQNDEDFIECNNLVKIGSVTLEQGIINTIKNDSFHYPLRGELKSIQASLAGNFFAFGTTLVNKVTVQPSPYRLDMDLTSHLPQDNNYYLANFTFIATSQAKSQGLNLRGAYNSAISVRSDASLQVQTAGWIVVDPSRIIYLITGGSSTTYTDVTVYCNCAIKLGNNMFERSDD